MAKAKQAGPERIRVELGRDFLTATVQVHSVPAAGPVTIADLENALAAAGVVHGIDPESLRIAIDAPPGHRTIVARGTPPRPGVDAVLRLREKPGKVGQPKALPDGRVDHRDLQLVKNVIKGQVLMDKEPAIPGRPGTDVCGKVLPPPPVADPTFPVGPNTAVTPDGLRLVALTNGHLVVRNLGAGRHEIAVDETFRLDRAVDMTTGNLDCIGACVVRGRVHDGFVITANGDITISGPAEGSDFTSREGSIAFEQGLRGHGKSQVKARGNVHARFIENATVETEGDIVVTEHVYHSTLRAGGSIRLESSPGVIMGGSISFIGRLACRDLGAPSGSKTRVYLGDWISREARARLVELDDVLRDLNVQMDQMRQALLEIRRLTLESEERHAERIATLAQSAEGFPRLRERSAQLTAEREDLAARIIVRDAAPTAEIAGTLHAGVIFSGDDVPEEVTVRNEKKAVQVGIKPGENGVPRIVVKALPGAPGPGARTRG